MKNLVVGSNSYLGINLCSLLDTELTWLVSKSSNTELNANFSKYIAIDLTVKSMGFDEVFDKIFILSRPISQEVEIIDSFYSGLIEFLTSQISLNEHIEIHFMSTTLVYNSKARQELTTSTREEPIDLYEIKKLEFEDELNRLSLEYPKASINTHRLPLLVGGVLRKLDREKQWLPYFFSEFKKGLFWDFQSDDKDFGTSWLDVRDFCQWLCNGAFSKGYNLWLPTSGELTYYDFMLESKKRLLFRPKRGNMAFPRSFLFIKSNTPLKKRELWESFIP